MNRSKTTITVLALVIQLAAFGPVNAQQGEDLAKAAQNPIANLISLPLQNNTNFNLGPRERTQNILNIQPVWPFTISEKWNLITRTIVPIAWVSSAQVAGDAVGPLPVDEEGDGLGDSTFTAFFSPKDSGAWTWGFGPVVLLPTATEDLLGSDKWGLGPSLVVLTMPGQWVIGSLFSNVWSVGGSGEQDVNFFTWQYFINYNIPDSGGWYLTSAPINTANWERESDKWTVPIGGGAGKLLKIGKQPINASAQAYYNVEKPQFGADWQLRLQLQFLFPK